MPFFGHDEELEINATAGFFPVPVASGVRSITSTDFFLLAARRRILSHVIIVTRIGPGFVVRRFFAAILGHQRSMPEVGSELYRLIKVSGADASEFLQGQLTQDVNLLEHSRNLPAAWCNPQGRVIATVRVIAIADAIGLAVAEDICEEFCERLLRFRFRSDVRFDIAGDDWSGVATVTSAKTEPSQADGLSVAAYESEMPLTEYFGHTSAMPDSITDDALSADAWRLRLIYAGVPFIGRANSEKFTPHMLNLDRLGAISFTKGCYTGQEIVARTEHRGSSKRRLMRYTTENECVAVGDKLTEGDRAVGEAVNVSGNNLLAVTPVAMQKQPLTIGGALANPAELPY